VREAVRGALQASFLPEFLNRIDETIIFHPLDKRRFARSWPAGRPAGSQLEQHGIALEVTEEAMDEIAREGYDPVYGARPLKRVIQQQIQNRWRPKSSKGVSARVAVRVNFHNGEFTSSAAKTQRPTAGRAK